MKIEIKCRFSGSVLFAHETEGNTLKITLEAAVKTGANLAGADLAGANLAGSYLAGANLFRANLAGANLFRADLAGANLFRADLAGANLDRANLAGADLTRANLARADLFRTNLAGSYLAGSYLTGSYLTGANLFRANLAGADLSRADLAGSYLTGSYLGNGEKLVGERPVFQIGPIGSRGAYFAAYMTDKGLRFDAGCQRQITRDVFELRLANEHGDNKQAKEYRAALALIDAHAELWTPKEGEE